MQSQLIEPSQFRLLVAEVLNQSPEWVFMHLPKLNLTGEQEQRLNDLVQRRLNGEPIAKILGYKEFYGRNFTTNDYTLDPRPDSETLIDAVLSHFAKNVPYHMLDFGLGTGCLLFTLLSEFPNAIGVGVDYSFEALKIAQKNQENLQLANRSICAQGSWGDAVKGGFDIIVSNPPYIAFSEVLDASTLRDPHAALFSGVTGLEAYQQLIPQLKALLKPYGKIFLEIGKGQELCVENIALSNELINQGVFSDLSGTIRVLCYSAGNA
jgi:release factor glutamine methyltransferase